MLVARGEPDDIAAMLSDEIEDDGKINHFFSYEISIRFSCFARAAMQRRGEDHDCVFNEI